MKNSVFPFIFLTSISVAFLGDNPCYAMDRYDPTPVPTPVPSLSFSQSPPNSFPLGSEEEDTERKDIELITNRLDALKELRSIQENVQKGEAWALSKARELRLKFKITDQFIGIESHQWPQGAGEVASLPVDQQLEAMTKVDPNNRYGVPLKVRSEILTRELSLMPTDDYSQKRKKEWEIKPQLALCLNPLTDSQEEGIEVLPTLSRQMGTLRQMVSKNEGEIESLELEKKRLGEGEETSPKKQKLEQQIQEVEKKKKKAQDMLGEKQQQAKKYFKSVKRIDKST